MAKQSHSPERTDDRRRPDIAPASLLPSAEKYFAQPRFSLIFALAYVVVMMAIGVSFHTVGDYHVETDFFWSYVPQAKQVQQGTFVIEDFRGPGYPTLLGIVAVIGRDFFRSGIILASLAAGVLLFVMFRLLMRLFRADLAFLAVLLTAFNPTFVMYCYTAGTDMVFAAWMAASMYFLFGFEAYRTRNIVFAALTAAGAYLTRYNGIIVVAAVPAILLVINPFAQEWKQRFIAAGVFVGVFFLAIAPWGIYLLSQKGSFFYNLNYLNIAYEMYAKGKMSWDDFWYAGSIRYQSLAHVVMSDPTLFMQTVVGNIYTHFTSDMNLLIGWYTGVFVLAGMIHLVFARPTRSQTAFLTFGAMFFSVLLVVFYGERFGLVLVPIYAALALRSLTWEGLRSTRVFNHITLGGLIALLLIAWTFHESYQFNRGNINSGPVEIPMIASTFRNALGDADRGATVIARKPHIAYYLDMKLELFPMAKTLDELRTSVAKAKAAYLFYGYMEAGLRPQFRNLLDPTQAPAWLVPVTYTVAPPAVLYRVNISELK
jgi:4-amino-4-deoxy-L-arabinose transferase-like glycosyltransferase